MKPSALIATLAMAGLAQGCVVGPDYRAPAPPAGFEAPLTQGSAATAEAPPDAWWRLFDDPALDRLVQQAFAANADLAQAQAHLSASRAALEAARNGLYPQTNINLGAKYGRDPTTDEILEIDGAKPQTVWLFDDLLDVSYELDLFGRVRRSVQAAHAESEAESAARDGVKITVAAETLRAYAQICALGEQLAVVGRSAEVTARQARIARDRRDAGAGSDFDVVRSEALAAQARAAIAPLEGQRRAALFQLTALLGKTPAQAPAEVQACVVPPRAAKVLPVGDGAGLLKRRPDVRLAERRVAAATARIGVAVADLYPRITLTGLYGGAATTPANLATNPGLAWGVGPDINWSFPNQQGPRAHIRAAKANAAAALAGFDSAVLQALKETEQALSIYTAELQHRQDLADAQQKAERALQMAQGQYLTGASSTLDTLTAEQAFVTASAALAASDAAVTQDQIALFKALGGGWGSARAD